MTPPDWLESLRQAAPGPTAEPAPTPEDLRQAPSVIEPEPQEQVPDWVRALGELKSEQAGEQAPSVATPQPEPEEDDDLPVATESESPASMPDWLAKLLTPSTQTTEETLASGIAEGQAAEMPAWMQEVDMVEVARGPAPASAPVSQAEAAASGASQLAEAETSDWLDLLRASQEAPREPIQAEEVGALAGTEAEPDWLAELRSAAIAAPTEPPAVSAPTAETEAEAIPQANEESAELEWLRTLETGAGPISQATVQPVVPGPEVPDWLREASLPTAAAPEPQATMPGPPEGEVPVWLQELSAAAASTASTVAPAAATITPDEEAPPWLRNLSAAAPTSVRSVEGAPPTSVSATRGAIVSDEIPEWLRKLQPKPEPVLAPGTLDTTTSPTPLSATALRSERPDGQQTEEQGAGPAPRPRRLLRVLGWGLVFVILIIAILVMLRAVLNSVQNLMGSSAFQQYLETPAAAGLVASLQNFRDQIASLPDEAVVVVSFDYSPATAAEMEPLASAVMRDLWINRARVLVVSLQPEGAAVAARLLDQLRGDQPDEIRSLNLGYLPGQTLGVRSLSRLTDQVLFEGQGKKLTDVPNWRDVTSSADVALIVLLADAAPTARWWIEQIRATPMAHRPMLAATSAAAGPLLRPYRVADNPAVGQLREVISGMPAAAAYEAALGQTGSATKMLAAQSIAHLGLVLFGLASVFMGFRAQALRSPED